MKLANYIYVVVFHALRMGFIRITEDISSPNMKFTPPNNRNQPHKHV